MHTRTHDRPGRRRALAIVIAGLVIVAGISVAHNATKPEPRLIAMFDTSPPGTPEAEAALQFAHRAHIDLVINYTAIDATRSDTTVYLDTASRLRVKVAIAINTLMGANDLDAPTADDPGYPENVAFHQKYAAPGASTDEQVKGIVHEFDDNSAVWGYYFSDELPETSADLGRWLPQMQFRYNQLRHLTKKHILASAEPGGSPSFLAKVGSATQDFMIDDYPFPDGPGQTYGRMDDIKRYAGYTAAIAGLNSWAAIQAFSYCVNHPEMLDKFHNLRQPCNLNPNNGAPNADWMYYMARKALAGGVRNIAFFSYGDASALPGELDEIAKAVQRIRAIPGF